jgi:hypothetical protein
MSLILTTNRIDENTNPDNPSSFKNFFRSPIEIEPDSEIAVQSVKVQRTGNYTIETDDFFCHYFGVDPEVINGYDSLTSFSRKINPERGTYSLSGFANKIKNSLNTQYDDPRTFGGYIVTAHTNASGQEKGFDMKCVDKGSASGASKNVSASLTSQATFNISSILNVGNASALKPSDGFTWTPATGVFEKSVSTNLGIGVLKGAPFGLNQGRFIVEVKNASAAPYSVGLTRPQLQFEKPENSTNTDLYMRVQLSTNLFGVRNNDLVYDNTDGGQIKVATGGEMYDYVFMHDWDNKITIAERVHSPPEDWMGTPISYLNHPVLDQVTDEGFVLQEIKYWENAFPGSTGAKLTKAQFHASWDGIMFQGKGDEIELYFKQNGLDKYDKVISSTYSNTAGLCFNPIGSTTYALYPQINIKSGSMTITKFESSNTIDSYKYPTFVDGIYTSGDDAFSNEALFGSDALPWVRLKKDLASSTIDNFVYLCDSSYQKLNHRLIETDPAGDYAFVRLNASGSVDYKHLFTMNRFSQPNILDTITTAQSFPNMSGRLGFEDRAFAISDSDAGYVAGDDTLEITFTSPNELQKTALASYIRIPNLTHKSYNGGQSGLSKIVYQLPQFSNDGRQYGALHFEPGEKTYVKLYNTTKMILNMLQVQIVDSQERELDSLTGDTQVVFHVRKSRM